MKKKLSIVVMLLAMLFTVELTAQQLVKGASTSLRKKSESVIWYKRINAGSTTYFTANTDTVLITGALDTLYSAAYNNIGRSSVALNVSGGSTVSFQLQVLTANRGDSSAAAIDDTHFKVAYWLKIGTGVTGSMVSTSNDSITSATTGYTIPIQLPLLDAEYMKFMVISNVTQSGNTTLKADLYRQER